MTPESFNKLLNTLQLSSPGSPPLDPENAVPHRLLIHRRPDKGLSLEHA